VQKYHLFKIAEDGRRREFEELVCRDDGEAVMRAKQFVRDHDVEVRCGDRYVFTLKGKRR
jgi:hypothetical protein